MGLLGDWVLREACRQVNAWASDGLRLSGRVAINVSAVQLEDPDIVGRLLEIVHEAGLSPERFELELTESAMMVDPERAVEVLELLSAAGFGLSIDDFGTGYSSLSYLKRFSADQIKIDISFVRNMMHDKDDHTIVTTIIAMARALGLQTTAEGVEDPAQAEALLALGCNTVQGFHFGHPINARDFAARWLPMPVTG
jgi:EAL domain-containing protein (putative c-di-GMP-specific phosphodiesterase class I)